MTSELLPSASFHLRGKMTLVSKFFFVFSSIVLYISMAVFEISF